MKRTLQHLVQECDQLPDVDGGRCLEVRGPFRASMTFAGREGTSTRESVESAASGIEVEVPQPEPAESVSADEATTQLQSLLARHAATADEIKPLAQIMIGNVASGPADEPVTCARILSDTGEGLVVIGTDYTWAVWMHADPSLPLPGRRPGTP